MYCTKCGVQLDDASRYCSNCGAATGNAPAEPRQPFRRLERPYEGRKVAGVCLGLAHYWGVDPVLVRILFVALALFPALPAIIPYIVCWIIMPNEQRGSLAHSVPSQA